MEQVLSTEDIKAVLKRLNDLMEEESSSDDKEIPQ
jgi:hypothetical protein